jgi:two-component system, NarL family, sensor kinase
MDSAIYMMEQAKNHALKVNDTTILVRTYGSLGRTLIAAGKAKEALRNLFAAMKLLEKFPDMESEVRVRTNITWAYLELKQYRDGIRFGRQSLKLMETPQWEWVAAYNYNNVAVCYGGLNQLDSARYFIEKSIKVTEKTGDHQLLANAYFILGKIYSEANRPDMALEQYLKAKPHREKVGDPMFIISDLYAIADLYYKIGNYQQGLKAAKEALTLVEKYDLLLKFDGTYKALAENYEGLKDFKNASKYYNLWALAKDSLYQAAQASAIAEMQTKYETEKKEQQIALQNAQLSEQQAELQRTNIMVAALALIVILIVIILVLVRNRFKRKQELARRENEILLREAYIDATIQSQENERKRFAQDLHDGMGQLISSLRLMVNQVNKNSTTEERVSIAERSENILNDMHKEIRGIAFNLMPQTLIQHGLVPALKEMAIRINDTGKISVSVSEFDVPKRLSEVQEKSVYRIVQEWINNVIKYAQAVKIEVQLVGHGEELSITIEDNGKGFDQSVLEESKGNGWKNIKSRVNLIKGKVEIDTSPERKGTTVIVHMPLGTFVPQDSGADANTH